MPETPFYATRMGARFYESTVPSLVAAVEKLTDAVAASKRDPAVQELVERAGELCNAAEKLLGTEIVPGSEATGEAFGELRTGAAGLRRALVQFARRL